MEEIALRYNGGKPQLGYILHFPKVIEALSRILEYGASKYEDLNWKKGGKPDKEYLDSAIRHLTKWLNDGPFDEESGCSHLCQCIWNLAVLFEVNHPEQIVDMTKFKEAIEHWRKVKDGRERAGATEALRSDEPIAPEREYTVCNRHRNDRNKSRDTRNR